MTQFNEVLPLLLYAVLIGSYGVRVVSRLPQSGIQGVASFPRARNSCKTSAKPVAECRSRFSKSPTGL